MHGFEVDDANGVATLHHACALSGIKNGLGAFLF
jgi:hypothetical protein